MLSIFPALIALVSIVGLVGDPKTVTNALTDIVSSIGPASAVDTFKGPIEQITSSRGTRGHPPDRGNRHGALDRLRLCGGFHAGLEPDLRGGGGALIHKLRPLQMLVTLVLVLLLALVLVALVLTGPVAEQVGSAVGLGGTAVTVWNIAKWPVLLRDGLS